VEIYSYNDHCSAPFSRACWLDSTPPTLLGRGGRHCHGINYTQIPRLQGSMSEMAMLRQLFRAVVNYLRRLHCVAYHFDMLE
jgi:hypothetical protein